MAQPKLMPTDRSLQAFKDFSNDMSDALGAEREELTDAEWEKEWREFWADADLAKQAFGSGS